MKEFSRSKMLFITCSFTLLTSMCIVSNSYGMESKSDSKSLKVKEDQKVRYVIPGLEKEKAAFDTAAKALLPATGEPSSTDAEWYEHHKAWLSAANQYQSALTARWVKVSEKDALYDKVESELKHVMIHPLDGKNNHHSVNLLAFEVFEPLARNRLSAKHLNWLSKVIVPMAGVRINDAASALGLKTEPLGWEIQQGRALILVRQGKVKQGNREIAKLDRKAGNKSSKDFGLDYGPELGKYRYKKVDQYRVDILVIKGLIQAKLGNYKAAEDHIEAAGKIKKYGKMTDALEAMANEIKALKAKAAKK